MAIFQSGKNRQWAGIFLTGVFCIMFPTLDRAESVDSLKAAFILNFIKFTEFPVPDPLIKNSTLVIATVGTDPLTTVIKSILEGKTAQGRQIEVHFFKDVKEWERNDRPCHALYVSPADQSSWAEIRATLADRPILTISEFPGFCAEGGLLNLQEQGNRIRFEANLGAAEKQGLKLRSELLKLATPVATREEIK